MPKEQRRRHSEQVSSSQRARQENLQIETNAPSTPTIDMEMLKKQQNHIYISTIAFLWSVKVILEKRASTVVVDTFIFPERGLNQGLKGANRACPPGKQA